ncbi:hypothetical protein EJD97_018562, partial [Solanum chilense]
AYVATFVSHIATDYSSIAKDELFVAICVTNIDTDESSIVVHSWITPTEEKLQMSYLITLALVETIFDPIVDRVKMVLAGATTIKKERLPIEVSNELVVFYADDGVHVDYGAAATACVAAAAAGAGAGQHEGATSCR